MREAQHQEGRNAYIYDAERIDGREVFSLFADLTQSQPELPAGGGRGAIRLARHADHDYVVRHYHRGGALARLSGDRYLWNGLRHSRPWREWRLLAELYTHGLPVPRPLAARLARRGVVYRADLATARLPADGSLADVLTRAPLPESVWQRIGRLIWDFHAFGIWHADLNAHNVLLTEDGAQVWLLDFDKARRRTLARRWQRANLERLRRSLEKLHADDPRSHFTAHQWHCLFGAYSKASNTKRSPHIACSRSR